MYRRPPVFSVSFHKDRTVFNTEHNEIKMNAGSRNKIEPKP